jgi:hypothetical protein
MSTPLSGNTKLTTPHDYPAPDVPNVPRASNPAASTTAPTPPTNQAPAFLSDAEVLRFVADHMDTGVPPDQTHLLDRANEIIMRRRDPSAARFEYYRNNPEIKDLLTRLQSAASQGQLPDPYPMSTDPLKLESWVASATRDQVAFVARQFPNLHNCLMAYLTKVSAD